MTDTESVQPPSPKNLPRDLRVAIAFLTRIPVGDAEGGLAAAVWAFPVAGLLVGLGGGICYGLAIAIGAPAGVAALLALAATALITGALHEDGLADTADGFGGGTTPERKLEIMRDSRSGAFGVLALVFSVTLRATALAAISEPAAAGAALIAAAALSRGLLPGVMTALPLASRYGLAAAAGRPTNRTAWAAAGIGTVAALVLLGPGAGVMAIVLAGLAVAGLALLARRQIGGYNGDTLGAAQQLAETAVLIAAAAHFA